MGSLSYSPKILLYREHYQKYNTFAFVNIFKIKINIGSLHLVQY
jgi:hypothetical protein